MWTVSSSEITSLHSVLNFFLPSLMSPDVCGKLSKSTSNKVLEFRKTKGLSLNMDVCLHWFDGETVALVDIYAEVVDHLLQLGLGLFPSLSINLLSLRFGRFSCFLFFFNVFGVFTCHCGWSSTRANHCTGLVAAKRLARLSNFLFRFFNLARFFIGLTLAFCFGFLFSLKLFFLLQKASFLVSLVFPLNFLVALFSHAFLFFVKSLLFLQQNFTFSLLYFELLFSFLLFDELSLSLQLRISFLFSLFSS